MFEKVPSSPPDPMFNLKKRADSDLNPCKVDLGVGIYRNEEGEYHELKCIKDAKKILETKELGHNYELTTGNERFLNHAARIIFGSELMARCAQLISSVQAISGTGACHIGALLLQKCHTSSPRIYIGTPAWGNYEPLFRLVGLSNIHKYTYYDSQQGKLDFDAMISAMRSAPKQSIFMLQACCHNPTGMDLTHSQWEQIAMEMEEQGHIPFFDIAYQGLGTSLEEDAWPVRYFAGRGFEMVVCQSFSKNFALYGERCGVLHVVTRSREVASMVRDQLRCLIRWEFSSSPAYGSRLVSIIAEDIDLRQDWLAELDAMKGRLQYLRKKLRDGLVQQEIPGDWSTILRSTGLFCPLPLNASQCEQLCRMHIYLPPNGRINVSGLNEQNMEVVVAAICAVVERQVEETPTQEINVLATEHREGAKHVPPMLEPRL